MAKKVKIIVGDLVVEFFRLKSGDFRFEIWEGCERRKQCKIAFGTFLTPKDARKLGKMLIREVRRA